LSAKAHPTFWNSIAGVCLLVLSFSACYVSLGIHFALEFLDQQFGNFVIGILVGWVFTFIGFLRWATTVSRAKQLQWSQAAFVAPFIAGLVGFMIDGGNVHGSAPITFLTFPALLLALVLVIMSDR
jgi:hypothetical protein